MFIIDKLFLMTLVPHILTSYQNQNFTQNDILGIICCLEFYTCRRIDRLIGRKREIERNRYIEGERERVREQKTRKKRGREQEKSRKERANIKKRER